MNNEERAEVLIKRYDFDFNQKYHAEIRQLLENEIINYQEGSSEYLRFLCGYLTGCLKMNCKTNGMNQM